VALATFGRHFDRVLLLLRATVRLLFLDLRATFFFELDFRLLELTFLERGDVFLLVTFFLLVAAFRDFDL
jgi:hypothetical protein